MIGLSNSAGQAEFDSGITLDAVDQSRFSAPVPSSPRQKMEDIHKMKSFDEKFGGRSPKMSRVGGAGVNGKKHSLANMQDTSAVINYVNQRKFSRDRRHDSAVGSAELIIDEDDDVMHNGSTGHYPNSSPSSHAPPTSAYDHLSAPTSPGRSSPSPGRSSPRLPPRGGQGHGGISLSAYDHLDSSFAGLSLKNAFSKRKDAAYVES